MDNGAPGLDSTDEAVGRSKLEALADAVEGRVEVMVDEIMSILDRDVPTMRSMSEDARLMFRSSALAETRAGVGRIRSGARLIPLAAREGHRRQGEMFAEQGVPLRDLVRAFEVSGRVTVSHVIDEAMRMAEPSVAALTQYLILVMDQLTSAVAIVSRAYTERANELHEMRRRHKEELVADLVSGAAPRTAAIVGVLRELTRTPFRVVLSPLTTGARIDRARLEDSLNQAAPGAWWAVLGSILTIILPIGDEARQPTAVARLAESLKPILGEESIIAVGPVHTNIAGIRESFLRASDVSTAAAAFGLSGQLSEEDVVCHRLLLASRDSADQIATLLSPLVDYDEKNAGALIETLDAFIENRLSVKETALALNIHRNTLRYRLDLIGGLLNTDIGASRLALKLALMAISLRGRPDRVDA